MFKFILVALVFFSLGLFVRPLFFEKPTAVILPSVSEAARMQLQNLTDQDIADYYRLKSLEEKYKKADEILAKIVMIFLHDLSLRVSDSTLTAMKSGQVPTTAAPQEIGTTPAPIQPQDPQPKWFASERARDDVRTQTQAASFLDSVKIQNFDEALKSTTGFKNTYKQLADIKGSFEGTADVVLSGKPHTWTVEVVLNGRMQDSKLNGRSQVKLSENGKVFSNSSDKGEVRSLREFTEGSEALLMRTSPTMYFQLYYLKYSDSFIGNIYRAESESMTHQFIGTIQLRRR